MSRTLPSEHAAANTSDACLPELENQLTDVTNASNPATLCQESGIDGYVYTYNRVTLHRAEKSRSLDKQTPLFPGALNEGRTDGAIDEIMFFLATRLLGEYKSNNTSAYFLWTGI